MDTKGASPYNLPAYPSAASILHDYEKYPIDDKNDSVEDLPTTPFRFSKWPSSRDPTPYAVPTYAPSTVSLQHNYEKYPPMFTGDPFFGTWTPPMINKDGSEPKEEGGLWGWLTVFGVFLTSFMAFGVGNVWGIFLNAYLTRPDSRFRNISRFQLGFVGGSAVGFAFSIGPFSNILVARFGVRVPILMGVTLMTLALELASVATVYWQLLLSQGVMFG
jgi:hypothetical protein